MVRKPCRLVKEEEPSGRSGPKVQWYERTKRTGDTEVKETTEREKQVRRFTKSTVPRFRNQ